ncbi:MAG: hypothetical protein IJF87_01710 [Erysipelotrichaceae bacterium]|nr:hypothetical protein [Erysipelotrichaceae bacterium]
MKIYLKDLMNIADEKVYPVDIEHYEVEDNLFLRRLENVSGDISFYYGPADDLRINYSLSGDFICPCAFSLEDVRVPFELNDDDQVVTKQNEEGFFLDNAIELEKAVLQIVLPEVPIKVEKKEKIEYSSGDSWSFVSEEDYESSRKDEIDPRLQKLMEYKFEEED